MWVSLQINGGWFAIKAVAKENNLKVILCDTENIWQEEQTSAEFFERCKTHNPILELSDNSTHYFIHKIVKLLLGTDKGEKVHINLSKGFDRTSGRLLRLETHMRGAPFKYEFELQENNSSSVMHSVVILPLLRMVYTLENTQRMLIEAVKKKDIEINEYKMEGIQLKRKNVETRPFEEITFLQECDKRLNFDDFNPIHTFTKTALIESESTVGIDLPHLQQPMICQVAKPVSTAAPETICNGSKEVPKLQCTRNQLEIKNENKSNSLDVIEREKKTVKKQKVSQKRNLNL